MEIINRDEEITKLNDQVNHSESRMGIVYGRRRVGKTFLLDNLWPDQRTFYFLAGKTTPRQNRRELLADINREFDTSVQPEEYENWRDVFRLFLKFAQQKPLIVILDEFQYFLDSNSNQSEVTSNLSAVWDRKTEEANLTLFLCGSEISVMKHLNDADQPLHGRIGYFERLSPFDYYDASRMMGPRSLREYLTTYGIYGGMPAYLAEINEDATLKQHVCRNLLRPSGPVYNFLDTIFKMEQGMRQPGKYRAVLTAVAQGYTEVNDIAQVSGVTGKQNEPARRKLSELEDLFLIRRERNFGNEGGAYRYYVEDPAVNFWYRFVHNNRKRLEQGHPESIWDHRIKPLLSDYMGTIFERVCYEGFCRFAERWELTYPVDWERWEGKDYRGDPLEIDVVSELDDRRLLVGEIKWSSSPVAGSLHDDLLEKIDRLKRSGEGWAHQASKGQETEFIYFSAAGFTKPFEKRARNEENITLITLDDLYLDFPT